MRSSSLFPGALLLALHIWVAVTGPAAWASGAGGRLIPIGSGRAHLRSLEPYRAPSAWRDASVEKVRLLEDRYREARRIGPHHRSPRPLLSRLHSPERLRGPARAARAAGDTIVARVAGLRVAFTDPGRATRGHFDLTPVWDPLRADTMMIDPPPHDSLFFARHMEALSQYYQAMFYGQLKLEYEVFPRGAEAAYVLDSLGAYGDYDPEETGAEWTVEGLEWLVKDCLRAADADTGFHFHDWDAWMIIHAGPDFQTDINRDSPDDIPSFYIYFGDTLWVDVTETDSTPVLDASMVPESVSQDGLVGGLNGVLAHEFGHQLGLPDLYDIYTGLPQIGYWGLMDSGDHVAIDLGIPVIGVLPASLSAWSRLILSLYLADGLDFLEVTRVETMFDTTLQAIEAGPLAGRGRVLQIPLTGEEYYLVENRQDDVDGNRATWVGDELRIWDGDSGPVGPDTLVGALYQDKETGVVLGPSRFVSVDPGGELPPFDEIRSWEYDAGLPGQGLLVWHVDEEVVFETSIDSTGWGVNSDPLRPGVALEEADGIPDLGDWRSFYWLGSAYDPFYLENADSLTPNSFPNTNSNLGGVTGVRLTDIGPRAATMHVRVDRGWGVEGFPLVLTFEGEAGSLAGAPAAGDVDGDGTTDLVSARGGRIYVLGGGTPSADSLLLPGWPVEGGASDIGPVALGDLDGDGAGEVLARTSDGRLAAWRGDGTRYFDERPEWGASFTESLAVGGGPPLLLDLDGDGRDEIVAGGGSALLAYADSAGVPRRRWTLPAGRLSGRSGSEVVALAARGAGAGEGARVAVLMSSGETALVDAAGRVFAHWRAGEPSDFVGGGFVALGDLARGGDGEGDTEILVVGSGGFAAAFEDDGSLVSGRWPVELGAPVTGPAALADVDGDRYLEVVIPLEGSGLAVLRWNGVPHRGSPWRAPVAEGAAPVVVDLEGDGAMEVLLAAADGLVYGWRGDGTSLTGWPLALGRGPLSPVGVADWRGGNGSLELAALDGIGELAMVRLPGWEATGEVIWGQAFGGARRLSYFSAPLDSPTVSTGGPLLAEGGVFVYPSPARGVDPVVRLELGGDALVTIRVFTLSGELVETWSGHLQHPVDEWTWEAGDAASGLYLLRIHASEGLRETALTRMVALIR